MPEKKAMLTYLIEIRERSLKIILIFLIFFSISFYFSNDLFKLILSPLQKLLSQDQSLIATHLTSAFTTPLILAANFALIFTAPFALYQFWRFLAPSLYRQERYLVSSLISLSFLLFIAGMAFCFYLVLPFIFQFFTRSLPAEVSLMPEISSSLSFITHMLLIFGLCFQLPLLCFLLVKMRWIDLKILEQTRPYAIVIAFVLGMILTPPDVISQICLALPLCLLYELGIIACKISKLSLPKALEDQ